MRDFWRSSGYGLLNITEDGRLGVTSDYARAFWMRPEVAPMAESCDVETALHERLIEDPFLAPPEEELNRFADRDTADNYRTVAMFLAGLKAAGSVERFYASLFTGGTISIPPIFIDQLVHVLLRHVLRDTTNPLALRAAEIFFRSQRVTVSDGLIRIADEETIEMYAATGGLGNIGKLLVDGQAALKQIDLDILGEENAEIYWQRSDRFDTVLDITFPRPGLDALCRVMEAWIVQFTGLESRIHPVQTIKDERWRWHIGLDAQATAILNDLYQGADVPEDRLADILNLFRMEVKDGTALIPDMQGKPIYLGLAKSPDDVLAMKPQNLLTNLPLPQAA